MPPRSHLSVSGVYLITCSGNGCIYVGSSKYITDRWNAHLLALRKGYHHAPYMQRSWNKYGKETFSIDILEETEFLVEREQHYIDTLSPQFNVAPLAYSSKGVLKTKEQKKRISEMARERNSVYHWNGGMYSLVEISEQEGVDHRLLLGRVVGLGWSVEKAVNEERGVAKWFVEWKGDQWYYSDLAKELGVSKNLLYRRTRRGDSVQSVLDYLKDKEKKLSFMGFCRLFNIPHTTVKSRWNSGKSLMEAVTGEVFNGSAN